MPSQVADSSPIQWKSNDTIQPAASATASELLSVIAGIDVTIAQNLVNAIACPSSLLDAEQIWLRLRHVTDVQLQQVQGISHRRAARILAALEFGKQVCAASPRLPRCSADTARVVDDPGVAAQLLMIWHILRLSALRPIASSVTPGRQKVQWRQTTAINLNLLLTWMMGDRSV
jgi:hypothetical protein